MKKKLLSTLLLSVAVLATGCDAKVKKIQNTIKEAQSFIVEVEYDELYNNHFDVESSSLIETKTTMIISLTDDYYNLDVVSNISNAYTSEEFTDIYKYDSYLKMIDGDPYGRYSDSDDPIQQYWLKGDSAFIASAEAEDFVETFKDKDDAKGLLEKISNGITTKKDANKNYLLDSELVNYFKNIVNNYVGTSYLSDINYSNEESYFDAENNSLDISYVLNATNTNDEGSTDYKLNANINIREFSNSAKVIEAPEEEKVVDGGPINGLFTKGNDTLEIQTYFTDSYITFTYKNENGEFYFFVYLENDSILEYGVPCDVTVESASGWNGAILGDSTPYSEYFTSHTNFELTLYEDNTFDLNIPTLEEILKWYEDKNK